MGLDACTTVFTMRAAVDTKDSDAILSGISRACAVILDYYIKASMCNSKRWRHTSSCAVIPPIETPTTCNDLCSVH